MKKVILVLSVVAGFSITSCKKCQECHYDKDGTEIEIGEICGDDLKEAEDNGYAVGDTVVTIHCEAH